MEHKQNYIKMTYDIVFKKFFIDKPRLLKLILKHFLDINSIQDIIITNPEIPELEEAKNKQKQLIEKNQEKNLTDNNETTKELSFLDSSLPVENREGKRVFLDLRVKLSTGEDINVEVQTTYKKHFLNRILYYWAKLHSQSLKEGEGYDKITPTYSLIFTEKPFLDKRVKDFMSSFSIRRDEEPYILFNKDLKIVIVELSKFDKTKIDLFDFKEFWCYFLKKSGKLTKEDRKYLSRHEELKEAMKHFDKLSQEEKLQQIALDQHMTEVIHGLDRSGWIEEGRTQGRQEGRTQGRQEGKKQGKQEGREEGIQEGIEKGMQKGREDLILKMLEKGCSVFEVSQITDLSEAEILELKNK